MPYNEKLAPEVSLVWEVMTCLGLRTTYDRPDRPCHWFNDHYGPYPAYASCGVGPIAEIRTEKEGSFPALSKGKRFNIPEIMSGCRKAPIMSIGINPNLTAYQHGIDGTTWCYPYFDDITAYAKHFRYRTVNQESFQLDFIREHLRPGTQTVAQADGKIVGMSVKNDVLTLNLKYKEGESETVRLPADRVLLFDTHDSYGTGASKNAFRKGDVIAGQLALPENVNTEICRKPVGYYQRFQKMIEAFKSIGDEALRNSQVRLGEDASMGDMVSCASPGWNAYFPDNTRQGIVEECVRKRQYFRRQVIQSRPAVIVFSGEAAMQMFMDAFPIEMMPMIDENQSTYERLKACLEVPCWLNFHGGGSSFRSRLVFSPHFSYPDSFDVGCRLSRNDWDTFEEKYPEDAAMVQDQKKSTFSGVLVAINPDKEPYGSGLSAKGKSYLSGRYIDPIDTIARVMLQEYDEKRLQLDKAGEHLVRTDGPCRFCNNELFQIGQGCLYDKKPKERMLAMRNQKLDIFGLHGSSHTTPMDTMVAYWAATGAGGTGFVAGLHLNKSGSAVCCPSANLENKDGESIAVLDLSDEQLREYDAGASFHSTVLDTDYQPTGETGTNFPWTGNPKKNDHLYHPKLIEVLRMFGRRTRIFLMMQEDQGQKAANALVKRALIDLQSFGLADRVTIIAPKALCAKIHEQSPGTPLALIAPSGESINKSIVECQSVQAEYLYAPIECAINQIAALKDILPTKLLLSSDKAPMAPPPGQLTDMMRLDGLAGLCFRSVESCMEMVTPPANVLADTFAGTTIDRTIWTCGYSHQNQDTQISQCDGLTIKIKEGGSYSGGAAVTLLPIHGRFDARVDFHVANPHQGTTFEMAAIGIDPGYFHIDNTDLNSRTVNLTFDVHGAPPYASSERDENDGFRLGWNNGYNLTKVDADWEAASVNMYNKYSRDVGNGAIDNPKGTLRLVRNGSVFNAYCKDKYNDEWVCTGSELIPNLGPDIHLRLAAKHWNKGGKKAPHNQVTFLNFRVFQF